MEIIAVAEQTVAANQNVLFTDTVTCGNCSIAHRDGSGLVTLRGNTNQPRARYRVSFGGNIAIPTGETVGPVSLAIAINGEPVLSSTMIATPAAVDQYQNVYGSIYIDVSTGCCMNISVQNISTIPVEVQNANLIVERRA